MSDTDDDAKPVPGFDPKKRARPSDREHLIRLGLLKPAPDGYAPPAHANSSTEREPSIGERYGYGGE
jgi:hypothetical protein